MGLFDRVLDRSILFSFSRGGYLRHQREFVATDLERSMKGKVCLITGANAGLGFALARGLAARQAEVHLLCRDAKRGAAAQEAIRREAGDAEVYLHQVDLSSLSSVASFAEGFASPVDVLAHNAGVLPRDRELTEDGLELTVATHLVGPFVMTHLLRPKLAGARVIFVSSGGMYAKRMDVDAMTTADGPYDGVAAYAMTKRGQVILAELWADQLSEIGAVVNAMHPGWAATKSVERSLPRFNTLMRRRLRTAEQGADTALWLAVADSVAAVRSRFFFDRKAVPTHYVPWTKESDAERQRLWDFCKARCDAFVSSRKEQRDG